MIFHGRLANLVAHFAAQFRDEGRGLIYRRGGKGPAIPVTAAERDTFIRVFDRDVHRLGWGVFLATVSLLGAIEIFPDALPATVQPYRRETAMAVVIVAFLAAWWRVRGAPARALARRAEIGNPLPHSAVVRDDLARLPWSTVAAGLIVPVILFVRVSFDANPWHEDFWSIIAGVASFLVVAAVGVLKSRRR